MTFSPLVLLQFERFQYSCGPSYKLNLEIDSLRYYSTKALQLFSYTLNSVVYKCCLPVQLLLPRPTVSFPSLALTVTVQCLVQPFDCLIEKNYFDFVAYLPYNLLIQHTTHTKQGAKCSSYRRMTCLRGSELPRPPAN